MASCCESSTPTSLRTATRSKHRSAHVHHTCIRHNSNQCKFPLIYGCFMRVNGTHEIARYTAVAADAVAGAPMIAEQRSAAISAAITHEKIVYASQSIEKCMHHEVLRRSTHWQARREAPQRVLDSLGRVYTRKKRQSAIKHNRCATLIQSRSVPGKSDMLQPAGLSAPSNMRMCRSTWIHRSGGYQHGST